ncbi:MAG: nucleotide sugar dehydrogenase [Clostridia bacterium]|nr:nucleotide sugar dehydrogenase [Clostridia bacterium]
MKKKICIIGLGYIGLPTAAMFATHGHKIVGVDINKSVVDALNQGKIIIEEPYLDIMVQAAVTSGNLRAQTAPEEADVFIIAVPTPINKDKTADMTYVKSATESIVPYLREGNVVILESTSPPRTVEDLMLPILADSGLKIGEQLLVAHSPERVLPGRILIELVENNRIVGGINQASCEAVRDLYRTFVKGEIFLTDATTAEMCKLMENTFRDVNIALANELAKLCESMGINAWDVIRLSNKHPRVNLHQPGPGVGGHCLAVDPWFIVEKFPDLAKIIRLSRETNDSMPHHVFDRSKSILASVQGKQKITVLGATYKPNIDDIRESPVMELIELFEKDSEIEVNIMDPHVKSHKLLENDLLKAAQDSHLVILGVNHDEFAHVDFVRLKGVMAEPNVLDTRNFWDRKAVQKAGLNYYLLGN